MKQATSKVMKTALTAAVVAATLGMAQDAQAREQIQIVGSSTVYPFSTAVAEKFGRSTKFKSPVIESTGTGGGFKLFCGGVGERFPDITNSSRRIKKTEMEKCTENGVEAITEIKIGYDGIVLANAKGAQRLDLEVRDIFLALAKKVPGKDGELVDNQFVSWKEVNAKLPDVKIRVLGPPPTSGTRDAFVELAMDGGCKTFPDIEAMKKKDKKAFKAICQSIREDGVFVEAGENDNLIVQKLIADPQSVGIFGYSYLDQNQDRLQGSLVQGVDPTFENIASGKYPVSRPLYFYVKKAHVGMVPGIPEFIAEFTSEGTLGDGGYLSDRGLIPAPKAEREQFQKDAKELNELKLP